MTPTPELLAPAGNVTCLHAAVRAGADAIYLGLGELNARRGADNFTDETLAQSCRWAHVRGRRIYLTANTIILPSEMLAALRLAERACAAGVDAFIVQDIGFAAEIARLFPEIELHISTQMNTHNAAGIEAAHALGASRVTLARELSLPELEHLCAVAHSLGIQVETFAHGALCICYSGQCFASSLVGGRSANRGMCAQVCRLPYELHNVAVHKALDAPGEHLLSPKDLCSIDLLEAMAAAGVDSLKIEGRMKSPEYVYAVTSTYRAVLDRLYSAVLANGGTLNATVQATPEEQQRLEEAFSRGFTQAYLVGETGNPMMSYGRPNNRGVRIGRVSDVRDGLVFVDCETPLVEGDVIEFWTNKGHFAHTISAFDARKGRTVAFAVPKPVGKGDRVFRVRSAEAAFVDDVHQPRVAVSGSAQICIGQPAQFSLATAKASAHAEGPLVEAARTKAITADEVREHIDRFGNTPFVLQELDLQLDEGAGMGFSALHHLRAHAAEQLEDALLASWADRTDTATANRAAQAMRDIQSDRSAFAPRTRRDITVCAWTTNAACARAARKAGVDNIYVPALNYKRGQGSVAGQCNPALDQAGYPKRVRIALPTVDHDPVSGAREERHHFDPWKYVKPGQSVFADSLGDVKRALDAKAQVEVGPHIPVTNPLTARYFETLGVARIWLSPELTLGQIQRIAEASDVSLGLFVSGAAELMVTEHCLLMSQGPCNQDCATCARRMSPHFLKDRKGYEMPVLTDCCGRSHLFNAVALDALHVVPDLIGAGIDALMVDSTLLNTEETAAAVARAVRARDLALRTGDALAKREGTTTGHLFRGIF